jgi:hypothetical protein
LLLKTCKLMGSTGIYFLLGFVVESLAEIRF